LGKGYDDNCTVVNCMKVALSLVFWKPALISVLHSVSCRAGTPQNRRITDPAQKIGVSETNCTHWYTAFSTGVDKRTQISLCASFLVINASCLSTFTRLWFDIQMWTMWDSYKICFYLRFRAIWNSKFCTVL
jgi:hypothetical protein